MPNQTSQEERYRELSEASNLSLELREGELLSAIKGYNLQEVKRLLDNRNLNLFLLDENKNTILHLGAMYPHYRIFKLLVEKISLESISNIDAKNAQGDTALHITLQPARLVTRPHFGLESLLIKAGANPIIGDKEGNTALHLAVQSDYSYGIIREIYQSACFLVRYLLNNNKKSPLDLIFKGDPNSRGIHILLNNIRQIEDILLADLESSKPKFVEEDKHLVAIWNNVKSKLEKEKDNLLQVSSKLWKLTSCKDDGSLALMFEDEYVKAIVEAPDFIEKYPLYSHKIKANYQIGTARSVAEEISLNAVCRYNKNKHLPEDVWRKILKMLDKNELKNMTEVSNLGCSFFRESTRKSSTPVSSELNEDMPTASRASPTAGC